VILLLLLPMSFFIATDLLNWIQGAVVIHCYHMVVGFTSTYAKKDLAVSKITW